MTTKLTLSIDEETVRRAKQISRKRGKSLSKMIEEYLNSITEKEEKPSAMGRIRQLMKDKKINVPDNVDYKEFIMENRYKDYIDGLNNREQ